MEVRRGRHAGMLQAWMCGGEGVEGMRRHEREAIDASDACETITWHVRAGAPSSSHR